jgi:hypothetical protein
MFVGRSMVTVPDFASEEPTLLTVNEMMPARPTGPLNPTALTARSSTGSPTVTSI